jgi:polyisoprenoid-binding protein YceI
MTTVQPNERILRSLLACALHGPGQALASTAQAGGGAAVPARPVAAAVGRRGHWPARCREPFPVRLLPSTVSANTLLLALCLSTCPATLPAEPVEYRFDPTHSRLYFHVDHLGYSRSIGRFERFEGSFRFDPEDPAAARAEVRIEIGSLDMGDAQWNRTLLGKRWFAADEHPAAVFRALRWLPAGDGQQGQLEGELTLRGITRPVTLDVRVNRIGPNPYTLRHTAGFSAQGRISRREFGLDAAPGVVGDEVGLWIEVEGQALRARGSRRKR